MTKIPWTNEIWNPVVGRNGNVLCREDRLEKPLHWRKLRKIFVMSDLFHENVPFEFIDKVLAEITICHKHIFHILTKRPGRMAKYFARPHYWTEILPNAISVDRLLHKSTQEPLPGYISFHAVGHEIRGPLPNLWLGTSISTQADADKNIPILLQIPSAVRFLSVEPMLERIDIWHGISGWEQCSCGKIHKMPKVGHARCNCVSFQDERFDLSELFPLVRNLDWVIVGCESGSKRRPCKLEWVEDLINQCVASAVPVFVKQLEIKGKLSRKPEEWPAWAQRQEYPKKQR